LTANRQCNAAYRKLSKDPSELAGFRQILKMRAHPE
jgi:hypothetical protein